MSSQIQEAAGVDEERPVAFPEHICGGLLAGRAGVPALHGNAPGEHALLTQRLHHRPGHLQRAHRRRLHSEREHL